MKWLHMIAPLIGPVIQNQMKHITSILLLLSAIAATPICAEALPDALQVEVLIFSGRPPPIFVITDTQQIDAIFSLVKDAPAATQLKKGSILGSDSGYQGFRIFNRTKKHSEMKEIWVYKSDIEIWDRSPSPEPEPDRQFRTDGGSKLQKELLRLLEEANVVDAKVMHWIKYGHITKVIPGKTLE